MITLEPNERIHLLRRRHQITLIFRIFPLIFILIFFFLLVLFFFFHKISWPEFFVERFPSISVLKLNFVIAFLFSLTLPIFWTLIFFEITRYYFTYWIITNRRIIEARLVSLFNVQYSSIELDKIQDMTVKVKGILASVYHFGDLRIQTAAEKGEFFLDQIGDPEVVKQAIIEAKFDYQNKKT